MYFPTSSTLIEFLILAILDKEDSYGYEISQTIKLIADIKESTLYPILKKLEKSQYLLSGISRSKTKILLSDPNRSETTGQPQKWMGALYQHD